MSTPIVVVAAIIRKNGCILLARRPGGVHLEGLWEFPGGKVDPGETMEAALVREVEEELGVRVAIEGLRMEVVHAYPDRSVHLHFYDCRLADGVPEPRRAEILEWARPEELERYAIPEANREVIRSLSPSA